MRTATPLIFATLLTFTIGQPPVARGADGQPRSEEQKIQALIELVPACEPLVFWRGRYGVLASEAFR